MEDTSKLSRELSWRPLDDLDVHAWSRLTQEIAKVDGDSNFRSPDALLGQLHWSGLDARRDTWGAWDGNELVGYATVWFSEHPRYDEVAQGILDIGVHPGKRGADARSTGGDAAGEGTPSETSAGESSAPLGAQLLAKAQVRAAERLEQLHPGHPHVLYIESAGDGDWAVEFLKSHGFRLADQYQAMTMPTANLQVEPGAATDATTIDGVDGVTVRPPNLQDSAELVSTHNEAFAEHPGMAPFTVPEFETMFFGPVSLPHLSRVAVDSNGKVLAYALVEESSDTSAYIALVGTSREARGKGIAKAVLQETLKAGALDSKVAELSLDVALANTFAAGKLYERVGFTPSSLWGAYQKAL